MKRPYGRCGHLSNRGTLKRANISAAARLQDQAPAAAVGRQTSSPQAPNSSFEGGNGCREQEGRGARCPRELAEGTRQPGMKETPGHKGAEADPAETPRRTIPRLLISGD